MEGITTETQSKELLGLGLPITTADFWYDACGYVNVFYEWYDKSLLSSDGGDAYFPAWSLGNLLKIFSEVVPSYLPCKIKLDLVSANFIDQVIDEFKLADEDGLLDFSLLDK